MSLVLYTDAHWISPYVYSCFVALHEKGARFETRSVALQDGAQHDPQFAQHSLTARVPALQDGFFWLSESSAIIEYLDETLPGPRLLPESVKERARARQLMAWLRSDLGPLREERPTTTMFYNHSSAPLSAACEKAVAKLLRVAETVLEGRTQLFHAWSQADADLAFMLGRLILNDIAVPPALRAFFDTQWARPSVRAFVERDRIPYVEYPEGAKLAPPKPKK